MVIAVLAVNNEVAREQEDFYLLKNLWLHIYVNYLKILVLKENRVVDWEIKQYYTKYKSLTVKEEDQLLIENMRGHRRK